MEELINKMVEKVGVDRATAERVLAFLKEHSGEVVTWLQGEAGQQAVGELTGSLGGLFDKK
jgi:hypothetical protein